MGNDFIFEPAPTLPGSDRASKYGFGAVRALANRLWDVTIEGRENVPIDGAAIITPNHLSFCDSVFVPAALPRRVWAIGKGEYMDDWKTKHIFPAMGMIPVDRRGGDAAKAALDTAAKVLDGGHLFMIYPEGTRSRSGNLHKGRTGAARLSLRCDAPIVPVGHQGTLAVQPPDKPLMKTRLPVTIRFGVPMRAAEFGDPDDPRTLRRFTDAVMFEIANLSGQKYVDQYAGESDKSSSAGAASPDVSRPSVVGSSSGTPTTPERPVARPSTSSGAPGPISRPPGRNGGHAPTATGPISRPRAESTPVG